MKQCLSCTYSKLQVLCAYRSSLFFYLYVQQFIFQIKLSGLSLITHHSSIDVMAQTGFRLRRIHSLKLLAETPLEAETEKMQQIVCSPCSEINYLTANIYPRNPESWHFCGITVDSSTLLIKKSRAEDKVKRTAAGGVMDKSDRQAKILHLASNNVPDPKSL